MVISSKEFTTHHKKYFDLAVNEDVFIKRNNDFFQMICTNAENPFFSDIPDSHKEIVRNRVEYSKTDVEGWYDWNDAKKII